MCPILLLFAPIITISWSIDDKASFLAQSSLCPSSCDYSIYCVLKIGTIKIGCRAISLSLCTILFVPISLCPKELLCIVFVSHTEEISYQYGRHSMTDCSLPEMADCCSRTSFEVCPWYVRLNRTAHHHEGSILGRKWNQLKICCPKSEETVHLKNRNTFCLSGIEGSMFYERVDIMNELFCNESLDYFPAYTELKDLRSTFIANCIFNNFLTYTSIMLNIVTIYAIRKTPAMAKTLKTLLLNLSCSDVGVGLFSQPLYTFFLVKWLQLDSINCNTYQVLDISGFLFLTASFFGVVAVSVERFLAVHLHLRYQELVTRKRVVVVLIGKWVCCAFFSLMLLWGPPSSLDLMK